MGSGKLFGQMAPATKENGSITRHLVMVNFSSQTETPTTATGTTTSNTDSLGAAIGARADTGSSWSQIEVAEILVYHAAHDAATRAAVEAYLTR